MTVAFPFPTLTYNFNPGFAYLSQPFSIGPNPGTSSNSYAITSGSLPAGLNLATNSGIISGTPTALTNPTTIVITATFPDTTTVSCTIILSVINIPDTAPNSNTASATGKTVNKQYFEQIFISSVAQMIQNQEQLGIFGVYADLPNFCSFNDMQTYFQGLGYQFFLTNPSQNPFNFISNSGGFAPDTMIFPDFSPVTPVVIPHTQRRVAITWTASSPPTPFWLWPSVWS